RSRPAPRAPSHHHRWLVDGTPVQGADDSVWRVCIGPAIALAGAGAAIRRFCAVAALVADRRSARHRARVLATTARRPVAVRIAGGSTAPPDQELSRRRLHLAPPGDADTATPPDRSA